MSSNFNVLLFYFFHFYWGITDKVCIYLKCTTWEFDICIYCEVITTIKPFNTLPPHIVTFFVVVFAQVQLSPFSRHHFLPSHPQSYPPLALSMDPYTCSLTTLPLLSPVIPLCPPLWLLSVCSLFQCLWLYLFACLFVLLIRFHL